MAERFSVDRQSAAPRHGVAGVDAKVEDDLFQLQRIRQDSGIGRLGVDLETDVLADDALEELFHFLHDGI